MKRTDFLRNAILAGAALPILGMLSPELVAELSRPRIWALGGNDAVELQCYWKIGGVDYIYRGKPTLDMLSGRAPIRLENMLYRQIDRLALPLTGPRHVYVKIDPDSGSTAHPSARIHYVDWD